MSQDPTSSRLELIAEINAAFADVVWTGGITIQEARAIDDYLGEEAEAEAHACDRETRWQEIPEDKLRTFHNTLPFFCEKSYRFYIPAYMIWVLRHLGTNDDHDGNNESTIFSFQLGTPADRWYDRHKARFDALDVGQKRAVCRFLRHLAAIGEYRASKYLDEYWGCYCD